MKLDILKTKTFWAATTSAILLMLSAFNIEPEITKSIGEAIGAISIIFVRIGMITDEKKEEEKRIVPDYRAG